MDTVLVLFHSSSPVLLKRGSLGLFPEPCLQLVLRCASRQGRHINVYTGVLIHIRSASCVAANRSAAQSLVLVYLSAF